MAWKPRGPPFTSDGLVGWPLHGRTSRGHAKRAVYRNLDAGGQPAAGLEVVGVVSGHAVGQISAIDVDLEVAAAELAADQLLAEGVFHIPLDGAAEGPGAVRAVLTGQVDYPVDRVGREPDLQAAVDQIQIGLLDQQPRDATQV